jgi:hypothetical protein
MTAQMLGSSGAGGERLCAERCHWTLVGPDAPTAIPNTPGWPSGKTLCLKTMVTPHRHLSVERVETMSGNLVCTSGCTKIPAKAVIGPKRSSVGAENHGQGSECKRARGINCPRGMCTWLKRGVRRFCGSVRIGSMGAGVWCSSRERAASYASCKALSIRGFPVFFCRGKLIPNW